MELRLLSAVCTAICIYSNAAMAVSFTPLGDLPGGYFHSEAYGVSADGSVVVGLSDSTPGVLVQRKFASMLAWQMTGRCLCQLASSQRRCFKMPT